MQKISAGLLMYHVKNNELKVFLVHPGGPFFKNKDDHYWGIPKGGINENEDYLEAAKREFKEETGIEPKAPFIPLGEVKQKSGKIVHAWAFEGDWNGLLMGSSYVSIEYPTGSKNIIKFPEIDKADFFTEEKAKKKIVIAQFEFISRLKEHLKIK